MAVNTKGRAPAWHSCSKCGRDDLTANRPVCNDGCDFSVPIYWMEDKLVDRGFNKRNGM